MSVVAVVSNPLASAWRLIPSAWRQPLAVVGGILAVSWLLIALLAPLISPYDPLAQSAALYQAVAGQIRELIEKRLEENMLP